MVREILNMLESGAFISGEMIARSLGITRTAVWKHIRALRQKGYQISSVQNRGYRLETVPDILTPDQIQLGLETATFGRRISYFEQVTSTQDEARKLAEEGAEEGTLVVAETQTKGRGRRQRSWVSPRGAGIYLSLVLRPRLEPFKVAQIPIVTGISIRDSIAQVVGAQPQTKWPNDIFLGSKKVAGILAEMRADPEKVDYIIIGVGINVNTPLLSLPEELRAVTTSLSEVVGGPISRRTLIQSILVGLEDSYGTFKRDGFEPFRERWRQWDQTLHAMVEIENAGGSLIGHVKDVGTDGALIVEDAKGNLIRINAGDATIRKRPHH